MSELKDKVIGDVDEILGWKVRVEKAQQVPAKDDLTLGDTAKEFQAAVLYVDIRNSTKLTDAHRRVTVGKVYNAFLNVVVRIVHAHGGDIRSFNGDGLLAFFDTTVDQNPSIRAVVAAKNIVFFMRNTLSSKLQEKKYATQFDAGVGIAFGTILAIKAGIRGDQNNDLVWPAIATNLAAKLGNAAQAPYNIRVSKEVFERLPEDMRYDKYLFGLIKDWHWMSGYLQFAGESREFWKSKDASDF